MAKLSKLDICCKKAEWLAPWQWRAACDSVQSRLVNKLWRN